MGEEVLAQVEHRERAKRGDGEREDRERVGGKVEADKGGEREEGGGNSVQTSGGEVTCVWMAVNALINTTLHDTVNKIVHSGVTCFIDLWVSQLTTR